MYQNGRKARVRSKLIHSRMRMKKKDESKEEVSNEINQEDISPTLGKHKSKQFMSVKEQ